MSKIVEFISTDVFKILAILLVGYILNIGIGKTYCKVVKTKSIHSKYIKNIVQALVVIVQIMIIFSLFEGTKKFTDVILASSGLMVAVLGFAAQESLSNIINGLFISIFKPFEIGDRISLISSGMTGTIEDISLRHTVILTFNNSRVIIPNSVMNKEIIENSHFRDARAGNFLDITVDYESDIDKAIEIIKSLVGSADGYMDIRTDDEKETGAEKVMVLVRELGAHGVSLRTTVWTKDIGTNFKLCSDLRLLIKKAFDLEGIKIPYNHIEVINR